MAQSNLRIYGKYGSVRILKSQKADTGIKFAIIINKKLANAVKRNKYKRMLRAILYERYKDSTQPLFIMYIVKSLASSYIDLKVDVIQNTEKAIKLVD